MGTYAQALDEWLGPDPEERRSGRIALHDVLTRVQDHDTAAKAMIKVADLLPRLPIKGVPDQRPLTKIAALSLASAMLVAERIDTDAPPEECAAEIERIVVGAYDHQREAAHAAVRQLGGARRVGLRPWMFAALGDVETVNEGVPASVISTVELLVSNVAPGLAWTPYAYELGVVLYRRS